MIQMIIRTNLNPIPAFKSISLQVKIRHMERSNHQNWFQNQLRSSRITFLANWLHIQSKLEKRWYRRPARTASKSLKILSNWLLRWSSKVEINLLSSLPSQVSARRINRLAVDMRTIWYKKEVGHGKSLMARHWVQGYTSQITQLCLRHRSPSLRFKQINRNLNYKHQHHHQLWDHSVNSRPGIRNNKSNKVKVNHPVTRLSTLHTLSRITKKSKICSLELDQAILEVGLRFIRRCKATVGVYTVQ